MVAKTSNYQLLKPSETDFYDINVSNSNMDIIDGELKSRISSTSETLVYYVNSSSGSDLNDGKSSQKAFKTIQKAIDILPKYLAHDVTINVGAGTYDEKLVICGFVGTMNLEIVGDIATPRTTKLSCISMYQNLCLVTVRGFELTSTTEHGVQAYRCSYAVLTNLVITNLSSEFNGFHIINGTNARIYACEISNKLNALYAQQAVIFAYSNTGTNNQTGARATYAGTVGRVGSQAFGIVQEIYESGGIITNTDLGPSKWNGWTNYSTLADLGLSGTPTVEQIVNKMPAKSRANIRLLSNPNMPDTYTQLTIEIGEIVDNVKIEARKFYPQTDLRIWNYNYALGGVGSSGWKEVFHSGNYGSVGYKSGSATLALTDANSIVIMSSVSNAIINVPTNAAVPFPIGTQIVCEQDSSGSVTFAPSAGVNISSKDFKRTINGQFSSATLIKVFADSWLLIGDLKA